MARLREQRQRKKESRRLCFSLEEKRRAKVPRKTRTRMLLYKKYSISISHLFINLASLRSVHLLARMISITKSKKYQKRNRDILKKERRD
jgi:hypothetical protein